MFLKYCSAFKFRVRQFKKNSCLRRKSGWLMWVVNGQRALQANRCGSRGGGAWCSHWEVGVKGVL
jgi:hypothetical protein